MKERLQALPLAFKLACAITALALTIAVGLTGLLMAARLRSGEQRLAERTVAYGKLASKQLEPAVAFNDTETAREVFQALMLDRDVVGLAVYDGAGTLLASAGDCRADPSGVSAGSARLRIDSERMTAKVPVSPKEGGQGVVVVEISTSVLAAARAEMIRTGAEVAAAGLLVGLFGAWLIGRSFSGRLGRLSQAAEAISRGELSGGAIGDATQDEIGKLGRAFDVMRDRLREMVDLAAEQAAEEQRRLDELVQERTAELGARNREMRFLLDHLGQGILSVDRSGRLGDEHSRALVDWFGAPVPGELLWSYLGELPVAPALEVGWSAILDDVLPLELAIDQLPKTFTKAGRTYEMIVSPAHDTGGGAGRFIVFFSDVTASVAQAWAVAGQRDLAGALASLAKDRSGCLAQLAEAEHLVNTVTDAAELSVELKRALHTLKGNAAMLGFESVAQRCHRLEAYIADTDELPTAADRLELRQAWASVYGPLEALCADRKAHVEVERGLFTDLRRAVEAGLPKSVILERLRAMTYEPVGQRLTRFDAWVSASATVYGKPAPCIEIDDGGIRFDGQTWEPFWSAAVHLIRNAVAHGIETPEERSARSKPPVGRLRVRCEASGDTLTISFADDGRGIDWSRIREVARERGLPLSTQKGLVEALFSDGFTTRNEADELSGRGQGLGAAREAVRALGGNIDIVSQLGAGTLVRLSFSLAVVGETIAVPRRSVESQEKCA